MIAILICGASKMGKDTFAQMLKDNLDYDRLHHNNINRTLIRGNAQSVKNIATTDFNWNGIKDDKGRQLLIDITENGYNKDIHYWEKELYTEVLMHKMYDNKSLKYVIIPDWRYEQSSIYFEKVFEKVIKVRMNRKVTVDNTKSSEVNYKQFNVDEEIDNTGSLDDLRVKVNTFVNKYELYRL